MPLGISDFWNVVTGRELTLVTNASNESLTLRQIFPMP